MAAGLTRDLAINLGLEQRWFSISGRSAIDQMAKERRIAAEKGREKEEQTSLKKIDNFSLKEKTRLSAQEEIERCGL